MGIAGNGMGGKGALGWSIGDEGETDKTRHMGIAGNGMGSKGSLGWSIGDSDEPEERKPVKFNQSQQRSELWD